MYSLTVQVHIPNSDLFSSYT